MTARLRPDTTSAWSAMRASEIGAALANATDDYTHEELIALLVNDHLNRWVAEHADTDERFDDLKGLFSDTHGKRIPYHGWYWRSVDWVEGHITIANSGEFVGVCENNKWGWDQRFLTLEEAQAVTALVWEAKCIDERHNSTPEELNDALRKVWDLFQTFVVPVAPWNQ